MNALAPAISVIDVRDGGPLRHAREKAAEARALRDACLAFFPRALLPALPLLDRAARRWLTRSRSPYVNEVEQVADTLGFPGVWLLNASYQWACTALAREEGGAPGWCARSIGRFTVSAVTPRWRGCAATAASSSVSPGPATSV